MLQSIAHKSQTSAEACRIVLWVLCGLGAHAVQSVGVVCSEGKWSCAVHPQSVGVVCFSILPLMSWELLVFQSCGPGRILSLHSRTIDCILRHFPMALSWMFTKLHRETWGRPPRPSIFKTYLNASELSCLLETVSSLTFLFSTQRHFQILAGVCFLYYDLKIPDRKSAHCSRPTLYSSGLRVSIAFCCLTSKFLKTVFTYFYISEARGNTTP